MLKFWCVFFFLLYLIMKIEGPPNSFARDPKNLQTALRIHTTEAAAFDVVLNVGRERLRHLRW